MANTVSLLDYTNTFGEWVVATNALVKENNDFAANNYIKPTGTLYLNDDILGLQVANNAIIAGQLQVVGVGSSAYVQNNLRVDTQVYFQNTTLGLTNAGEAIIGGVLTANGTNIGLRVANNTTMGGYLTIQKTLDVNGSTTLSNTLTVSDATDLNDTLHTVGAVTFDNTLTVADSVYFQKNLTVTLQTNTQDFYATNSSNTNSLIVRSNANVFGNTYTNTLQANTKVNTPLVTSVTLNATGTTHTDILQANTIVNSSAITATGNVIANSFTSNTSIYAGTIYTSTTINACNATLFANSVTVGTGGLSVLGNFTVNGTTVYNSPNFVLSASTPNQTSSLSVYRNPGANAEIRWEQANTYWSILDVNSSVYHRILTTQQLSDSITSTSTILAASSNAVNILNNNIVSSNTSMKSYVDTANTSMKSYVDTANTSLKSYVDTIVSTANTSMKSYVDTANTSLKSYVDTLDTSVRTFTQSSFTKANNVVQTAYTNITANGTSLIPASNADTLIITSLSTNGINVLANNTTKTIDFGLRPTGVAATTYGNTSSIPAITVDSFGRITAVSNTSISIPAGTSIVANSGQLTANASTGVVALGLATTAVTAKTYGSTNLIPVISVDSFGRITSVANTSISAISAVAGTTNQVTATNTSGSVTLSLPQSISLNSGVQFGTIGVNTAPDSANSGSIRATGSITASYSDERLKSRLGNIENALEKVNQLSGFFYEANETAQSLGYNTKREVGVSAQEVQKVLPEVVVAAPISDEYLTVQYDRLVPLIIEAIKELSAEVKILKGKL